MNPYDSPPPTPKFRPREAKTILVDASGYIFRAYYGLPPLSNGDGRPTQATFGFLKMLGRLIQSISPERLVLAFDTAAPTFRKETYSEYKANRPPPPEDLIPQFEDIHSLVDLLGIASVTLPGYEADDVLATLAHQAKLESKGPVLIISSDKDLLQLVDPQVQVWDTLKNVIYNEDEVQKKMGIPPERIPDYLGLVGDSSDNIPGVAGIGRKSAITLIQSFGGVEEIFVHANEAPPRCIKKLNAEGALDQAILCRTLAKVCKEAPIPQPLDELWAFPRQDEKLSELLISLNIPTGLGRFPNPVPTRPYANPEPSQTILKEHQEHPSKKIDLSLETFGYVAPPRIRINAEALPRCRATLLGEIQNIEEAMAKSEANDKNLSNQLEALALMLDMLKETKEEIPSAYEDDFGQVIEEIWLQRSKNPRTIHLGTPGKISGSVLGPLQELLKAKPDSEFLGLRFEGLEEGVLATLTEDPTLLSAINDGLDPYEEMANLFFSLLPGMATETQIRQLRAIHEGILMDTQKKRTASILGWSSRKTREAFAQYRECFPAIAKFADESKRTFKEERYLEILGGERVPWTAETANRQFLGLSFSDTPPLPAVLRIRESCYQICLKASSMVAAVLNKKLESDVIGYQGTTTLAFELPREHAESLQGLLVETMNNAIELSAPVVINPSRGDSLISI